MKKFLYTLVFAIVLAASFTACTEENVEPKTNESSGGAGGGTGDPS